MAKKKECIPEYGTTTKNGVLYYRTRITDADGKRVDLYAATREELYKKEKEARQIVEDLIFRKNNPTVADYCERWLQMQSAKVTKKNAERICPRNEQIHSRASGQYVFDRRNGR